jgi:hypothetical protein
MILDIADFPIPPKEAYLVFPTRRRDFDVLEDLEASGQPVEYWDAPPEYMAHLYARLAGAEADPGDMYCFPGQPYDKSYFRHRLATTWNALAVFIEIMERAAPRARYAISADIERRFWNEYDGVLLHPRIRALLERLEQTGNIAVLAEAEHLLARLYRSPSMKAARYEHLSSRVRAGYAGLHGELDEEAVASWELLADYILLQRACAVDIRKSSRKEHGVRARQQC